jgi:hypothetical protein
MRSRRSGSGRSLGDTKESDRRVTSKAPLGPTWNEGQASPRRRPQPFSRILTAWKGNSQKSISAILHSLPLLERQDGLFPCPGAYCQAHDMAGVSKHSL